MEIKIVHEICLSNIIAEYVKKIDEKVALFFCGGYNLYYKSATNGKNIRWRLLWK